MTINNPEMQINKTKLSIGLPTFNGEKHIEETIESILGQTYSDFILIISDNASTDSTASICNDFSKKDERVIYSRNDKNVGINENAAKVLAKSLKMEYFTLIGDDDVLEPTFVEKIMEVLQSEPDASLGFSEYRFIDSSGVEITHNEYVDSISLIKSMKKMNRRQRISFQPSACFTHGIVRTKYIDERIFQNRYGIYEDVYYLRILAASGYFAYINEQLFKKRVHSTNYSSSPKHRETHQRTNIFQAARNLKTTTNLSTIETIGLWWSLNFYFRCKKPIRGYIARLKRYFITNLINQ